MLYKGKVEINEDPKNLNRIKVRIFGIHPGSNTLKSENLQWADPIMMVSESVVPNVNDIVYCDFLDEAKQKIVYLGQASYESNGSSVDLLHADEELIADKNQDDRVELTRRNKHTFVKGGLKIHVIENEIRSVDGNTALTTTTYTITADGLTVEIGGGKAVFTSGSTFGDIKFGGLSLFDFISKIRCVGNLGFPAPLEPTQITQITNAIAASSEISIGV